MVPVLAGAVGWYAGGQRRTNSTLNNATQTLERVTTMLDQHERRIERLERWQDTDRYADVIEQRKEARG
jgi:hypothetical protein